MQRSAPLLCLLLLISAASYSQLYQMQHVDTRIDASFRGLSVADENAIWVSGSKGWIGRSTNGGKDWSFTQVAGYESLDFRTLYAFDSINAVIANAGSPAYILRTSDGGVRWKQVYRNTDSAAFIDGIDFWNEKHGLIHGDPINGRMLLLYTTDGGNVWQQRRNRPQMGDGEASFAASGTAVACIQRRTVVIAAGGKTSKLYVSRNRGRSWRSIPTPMLATSESTGIFSFMAGTPSHWFIAGGDYRRDTLKTANFFYTVNKGMEWLAPDSTTRGYRECLAKIDDKHTATNGMILFAVGPSGIDISTDDGVNWMALSDEKGFHVIKAGKDHKCLFLAGGNGKLAIMKLPDN